MEKEKKKQKSLFQYFKIFILIIILIFLYAIINQTYSKYVTKYDNNGLNSSIANWNIKVNNKLLSQYNSTTLLDLAVTWDDNEFIDSNTVAPTSSGSTQVTIESTGTQVPYKYTISLPTEDAYVEDFRIVAYKLNSEEKIEINNNTITNTTVTNTTVTNTTDTNTTNTATTTNTTTSTTVTSEVPKIEGIIRPATTAETTVINTFTLYFKWYDGEGEILNNYNDTRKTLNTSHPPANIKVNVKIDQIVDSTTTTNSTNDTNTANTTSNVTNSTNTTP